MEFFSDWQRGRYIEDLGRELSGLESRLSQLAELDDAEDAAAEAKESISRVKAELKRLQPKKPAKK